MLGQSVFSSSFKLTGPECKISNFFTYKLSIRSSLLADVTLPPAIKPGSYTNTPDCYVNTRSPYQRGIAHDPTSATPDH